MDLKIEINNKELEEPKLQKKKGRSIMKKENKQNKDKYFNFRVNEKEYNKIKSKIEKISRGVK